jgi:tRNA(adenine34) deaminase
MAHALALAQKAYAAGEVPVGAVVVRDGGVVGEGWNRKHAARNALCHAEMMAIEEAGRTIGDWRLTDCALYVTLEPCPMCAGAILNARVGTVVFGARDPAFGACGGVMNLFEEAFGYRPKLYGGVLETACATLLADFFREMRRSGEI